MWQKYFCIRKRPVCQVMLKYLIVFFTIIWLVETNKSNKGFLDDLVNNFCKNGEKVKWVYECENVFDKAVS